MGQKVPCDSLRLFRVWSGLVSKPTTLNRFMILLLSPTEEYGHGPASKRKRYPVLHPVE
jgi:hypothetical protein